MASLNKVILIGNLTADPELKQTQSGISVVSFTIAINRRYQSKNAPEGQQTADFINIVAWRQSAEFVSRFFKKGKPPRRSWHRTARRARRSGTRTA